jgi:2-polyprenyl-3-methyl-5-hydroxy-6-metoxy-1,4-benzoquinol methylase
VFGDDFAPRRVLDFGCGVGRVTLPLARRVDAVVAIDIADSMLSLRASCSSGTRSPMCSS